MVDYCIGYDLIDHSIIEGHNKFQTIISKFKNVCRFYKYFLSLLSLQYNFLQI